MFRRTAPTVERETPEQNQASVVLSKGGAANQNTWRNIGLIIEREFKNRVAQRSFVVVTIIILVMVIIAAFVPTIVQVIMAKTASPTKIALISNAGNIAGFNDNTLTHYFASSLNGAAQAQGQSVNGQPPFAFDTVRDSSPASISNQEQLIKNGQLNILLVIDRSSNQDLRFTYYTTSGDTAQTQIQTVAGQLSVLDKAARLGLTTAQTTSLFAQPAFNVINTQPAQDTRSVSDRVAGYIISYAGVILIFMSVITYGAGVATGVAEEKGNRIMEILVNAATPFQLMVGKIVGIGAAGLMQMASFVIVGILMLLVQNPIKAALLGNNSGAQNLNITGTSITLLALLLIYFILGFLLYATLFAALGALVKRQDEVQNAVQPITWLFVIGYVASLIGLSDPTATWVKIISYIPFWSPTAMLMRIGAGGAAGWEIVLTILLMIGAIFVCALISARIYRFGVLMYGQKPGLRELIRIASK